jgi:NADH:ubiquinone oxidoreductase subunit K
MDLNHGKGSLSLNIPTLLSLLCVLLCSYVVDVAYVHVADVAANVDDVVFAIVVVVVVFYDVVVVVAVAIVGFRSAFVDDDAHIVVLQI